MSTKIIIRLKKQIKKQISLINNKSLGIKVQVILSRSLLEDDAIFNFLREKHSEARSELFICYWAFAWQSHFIYQQAYQSREADFLQFLKQLTTRYPIGFSKYYRLIKRRLCKILRQQHCKTYLRLINSNKPWLRPQQFSLIAKYMATHLITKLPFPYRIVFGKSITFFVLKYSQIDRDTYWLLADLSHGLLMSHTLDQKSLQTLVKKVVQIVKKDLKKT